MGKYMQDQPLNFHKSLDLLIDNFRNVIAGMTWLKVSVKDAQSFYAPHPNIIGLSCSVTDKQIKVGKSILSMIEEEGLDEPVLYNQTLINFYRIFTIAIKDIVWEEPDFSNLHNKPELQFLRHIRNASAHNNQFFLGAGQERIHTLSMLPLIWRGKEIKEELEDTKLYMDFLQPGDLFYLLSDISSLA